MATQHGPIKIKGTIGDITFYKGDNGSYGAKAKSEVSPERIATDPAFLRTRENGQEFGSAGKSGKVMREAFQALMRGSDKRMIGRLVQAMMRCLKADTTSARGMRNVAEGDVKFLKDFDFNVKGKLGTTLLATYASTVTRLSGDTDVTIEPFVPTQLLSAPLGATHYDVILSVAEVDFAAGTSVKDTASSGFMPIDNDITAALTLEASVSPNSTKPIFQVMAVRFYQEVNGQKYALNNGSFDAVKIIKVVP